MKLRKFCLSKNHPKKTRNLLVGNLAKYRETIEIDIKDNSEGILAIRIDFPSPVFFDHKSADMLFAGAVGFQWGKKFNHQVPADITSSMKSVRVVSMDSNGVTVTAEDVRVIRVVPNCFVFCMSLGNVPPSPRYDSSWAVDASDLKAFSETLRELILQEPTVPYLPGAYHRYPRISDVPGVQLKMLHGPVNYSGRELIISNGRIPSYDEMRNTLLSIHFHGRTELSHEQEYRFIFEVHSDKNVVSINAQDMLIDSTRLLDFIEPR